METAAEMIVHSAGRHLAQREHIHLECARGICILPTNRHWLEANATLPRIEAR